MSAAPRRWTAGDEDLLRRCIADRMSLKETAARLGRSTKAIQKRCQGLGLRFDRELAKQRAAEHARLRAGDPLWRANVAASQRNAWKRDAAGGGKRRADHRQAAVRMGLSAMGRAACAPGSENRDRQQKAASRTARATTQKTMAWLPPHMADAYAALRNKLGARAARAAMAADIAAFARTFDGQLWRLATGQARLVENVRPPSRLAVGAFELTGRVAV